MGYEDWLCLKVYGQSLNETLQPVCSDPNGARPASPLYLSTTQVKIAGKGGINQDLIVSGRIKVGDDYKSAGVWIHDYLLGLAGDCLGVWNNMDTWIVKIDKSIGAPAVLEVAGNGLFKGKITAQQLVLKPNLEVANFATDQPLPDLLAAEEHLKEIGHLPEMPSPESLRSEGLDTGQLMLLLLRKIEELTRHLAQQHRHIVSLETKIAALESA